MTTPKDLIKLTAPQRRVLQAAAEGRLRSYQGLHQDRYVIEGEKVTEAVVQTLRSRDLLARVRPTYRSDVWIPVTALGAAALAGVVPAVLRVQIPTALTDSTTYLGLSEALNAAWHVANSVATEQSAADSRVVISDGVTTTLVPVDGRIDFVLEVLTVPALPTERSDS